MGTGMRACILIPAADAYAIYRAFCWLYENRDAARRMGEAGRQAAAVVREQNFERTWTGYIEHQLSAPPPPSPAFQSVERIADRSHD